MNEPQVLTGKEIEEIRKSGNDVAESNVSIVPKKDFNNLLATLAQRTKELWTSRQAMKFVESVLKQVQEERDELGAEKETSIYDYSDLRKERDALEAKCRNREDARNSYFDAMKSAEQERDELKRKVEELEETQKDNVKIVMNWKKMEEENEKLKREVGELEDKGVAYRKGLCDLGEEIQLLGKENKKLKEENAKLKHSNELLRVSVALLEQK